MATPHAHFAYILPYRARKSSGTYSRFVLCIMPHANFERASATGGAADDTPLVLAPRAKALESARAAHDYDTLTALHVAKACVALLLDFVKPLDGCSNRALAFRGRALVFLLCPPA